MDEVRIDHGGMHAAFDYLKKEAIDAHLAGDGVKAMHVCTLALRAIAQRGHKSRQPVVDLQEIRWAYFLGLYWMLDEHFLFLVEDSLKHTSSKDAQASDRTIIKFLLSTMHNPTGRESFGDIEILSSEYLTERSTFSEDVAALQMVIEFYWYSNPRDSGWEKGLESLQSRLTISTPLKSQLDLLHQRLRAQSSLYSGGSFIPGDSAKLTNSREQAWLLDGWKHFFNCEFAELDALLTRICPHINIDNPLSSQFFHLFHWARMHRTGADDQFVSLSHRQFSISRQPASVLQVIRDGRFNSAYSEVARQGYSDNAASNRLTCLRIAMINQIHALRQWDIGGWLLGERQRAWLWMELGSHGNVQAAIQGVLRAVRSGIHDKEGRYPHFDRCIQLLDAASEDDRRLIVQELITSPRYHWLSANRVLSQMSDSIPPDMLEDVAVRSAQLETDEFHSKWGGTKLEFWGQFLFRASNSRNIAGILYAALKKRIVEPRQWQPLHDTILAVMLKGSEDNAKELIQLMIEIKNVPRDCDEWRFSILYNTSQRSQSLEEQCRTWLSKYPSTQQGTEYQSFVLRKQDSGEGEEFDDPVFRDWLRTQLLAACDSRLSERGPSFHIPINIYHLMVNQIRWPRSESVLIQKLVAVADADYIPFTNKGDLIACLTHIIETGPKAQARRLVEPLTRWLFEGIPGRTLGATGPLSIVQLVGMDAESATSALLYLVDALAQSNPTVFGKSLAEWVRREWAVLPIESIGHVMRTVLALSIHFQNRDNAMSIEFIGIAEAITNSAATVSLSQAIAGFHSIVFPPCPTKELEAWRSSPAGSLCLDLWMRRLFSASRALEPSVREEVASTLNAWQRSGIAVPELVADTERQLAKDPRIRVRFALRDDSDNA